MAATLPTTAAWTKPWHWKIASTPSTALGAHDTSKPPLVCGSVSNALFSAANDDGNVTPLPWRLPPLLGEVGAGGLGQLPAFHMGLFHMGKTAIILGIPLASAQEMVDASELIHSDPMVCKREG